MAQGVHEAVFGGRYAGLGATLGRGRPALEETLQGASAGPARYGACVPDFRAGKERVICGARAATDDAAAGRDFHARDYAGRWAGERLSATEAGDGLLVCSLVLA